MSNKDIKLRETPVEKIMVIKKAFIDKGKEDIDDVIKMLEKAKEDLKGKENVKVKLYGTYICGDVHTGMYIEYEELESDLEFESRKAKIAMENGFIALSNLYESRLVKIKKYEEKLAKKAIAELVKEGYSENKISKKLIKSRISEDVKHYKALLWEELTLARQKSTELYEKYQEALRNTAGETKIIQRIGD